MIVTKEPVILTLPEPKKPRSVGIHNSSIIRCIATEQGILKPQWCEELSLIDARKIVDQTAVLRMCIGLAWEEFYIPRYIEDVIDHPDEMQVDGVYMSPDAENISSVLSFRTGRRRWAKIIHEVKATYKSTKTVGNVDEDDPKIRRSNWMWVAQLMGYCLAAKTYHACLHVLFLCGDYKRPIEPQIWKFNIEFEDHELINNWQYQMKYLEDLAQRIGLSEVA